MNQLSQGSILITGATGAVGPRVVQAFHEAGYRIRTLSLDMPQPGLFPPDVEIGIGDVTDWRQVQSAMRDVQFVVHLAALLHIVNPPIGLREQYERVNVDGTARVVEAAIQAGAKRLIFFSTIAVYGDTDRRILNESALPKPNTFYGETKLAAEQIVLKAESKDGGKLGTVLRFGAIYGPRIKGNYERLLRALSRGRFIPIGDGYNRRTLIYDRDVGRAAVVAAQHPEATGRIYNVSDGQFHTLKEIIETMCEALGRKAPRFSIPLGPARVIAATMEEMARVTGRKSGVGRATLDKYTEDVAVDSHRIQKELGFVPQFDLKAGWRQTVQEMRQSDEL